MANKRNEWQKLLGIANEDLKQYGYRLSVNDRGDKGFFKCVIYKGNKKVDSYAENYYEDELEELVNDAWQHVKMLINPKSAKTTKTVFVLYECDPWHSYSSMTANDIVGIATDGEELKSLISERLRNGWKDDIEEFVNDGDFESMDDFVEQALDDFVRNNNQTQALAATISREFYAEEITLNTLIL